MVLLSGFVPFITPPWHGDADLLAIQVDCEMTGLDLTTDRIIEIAVIITDGRLNPVDEGIEYVIRTPKSVLDASVPNSVQIHWSISLKHGTQDGRMVYRATWEDGPHSRLSREPT